MMRDENEQGASFGSGSCPTDQAASRLAAPRGDPSRAVVSVAVTISTRMAAIRKKHALTLQTVADRAGLSKSHVWEMEQGRSQNPTIETAVRLANALGVSLDYLTGLSTSEPNLHPDALRIACEVDALLRRVGDENSKDLT